MYCASCGTPLTQGLIYCNRCGANLREHKETKTGAITAFLVAITLIGLGGLGIMLGGALVLRNAARLGGEIVGVFMLFSFLIVAMTEFMLVRNLSKLTASNEKPKQLPAPRVAPHDLRLPQATPLGEPVPSVTENTTRTLEYARREQ
ncbi:MAG TPA: zinc ribbon domain-containing protein [Pyrinomonadaceae bacterium]|nr:zinc ribbon domain-containing protein [Pyrinomonadaceae bacterium]